MIIIVIKVEHFNGPSDPIRVISREREQDQWGQPVRPWETARDTGSVEITSNKNIDVRTHFKSKY